MLWGKSKRKTAFKNNIEQSDKNSSNGMEAVEKNPNELIRTVKSTVLQLNGERMAKSLRNNISKMVFRLVQHISLNVIS